MQHFAREQLGLLLSRLTTELEAARKSLAPERVHRLRIALRRFLTALRVFAPLLPTRRTARLTRRLDRIRRAANPLRDRDVALTLLAGQPACDAIARDRRHAERKLARRLDALHRREALRRWSRRLDLAEASASEMARRLLPRLASRFFDAGDRAATPDATPRQLHRFRLAAKRLRYTLDLFRPLFGPRLDAFLDQLRQIQTILGTCNDCVATLALAPENAAAAGLPERLQQERRRFVICWKQSFSSDEARRRWTRYLATGPGRRLDHPGGKP